MTQDAKRHKTLAAGENPTRAGLAASILSVNDVVPVASATEQAQVVAALSGSEFPVGSGRPLTTARADARGLHSIEVSRDGSVFVPASGVLSFTSKANATSWAAANGALLSYGDQAALPDAVLWWNGTKWLGDSPAALVFTTIAGVTYSAASGGCVVSADRGWAQVDGIVVSTSAAFNAGTTYTLGQAVPASFRPAKPEVFATAAVGASIARVRIEVDGTILFALDKTFAGALDMGMAPLRWRIG